MKTITLSQLDYLARGLAEDAHIKERYGVTQSELFEKLENITDKQRSYLWACMMNKKYSQLKDILHSFGVDRKMSACNGCGEDHDPEDCTHGFN